MRIVLLQAAELQAAELQAPGVASTLLRMIVALVLVCLLAYLALRLLRRGLASARAEGALLRVVERCPLSARQSLWVVQAGSRFLLIGATEGNLAKLAELEPEEVQRLLATSRPVGGWRERLLGATGRGMAGGGPP